MNDSPNNLNQATRDLIGALDVREGIASTTDYGDATTPSRDKSSATNTISKRSQQSMEYPGVTVEDHVKFLIRIHENPGLHQTELIKRARMRRTDGLKLLKHLQESCLIDVQEFTAGRGGKIKVPLLTRAGYQRIGEEQGVFVQGSEAHSVTAQCAQKLFELAGFQVRPEYSLAAEFGVRLDLMCRHKTKNQSVAVNICIDNAPDYEAQAAYRALQCPEVRAGRFCLIARNKSKVDGFKKAMRQLDPSLNDQIDIRLAGHVMRSANTNL